MSMEGLDLLLKKQRALLADKGETKNEELSEAMGNSHFSWYLGGNGNGLLEELFWIGRFVNWWWRLRVAPLSLDFFFQY